MAKPKATEDFDTKGRAFEDTVKRLLRSPPQPHEPKKKLSVAKRETVDEKGEA